MGTREWGMAVGSGEWGVGNGLGKGMGNWEWGMGIIGAGGLQFAESLFPVGWAVDYEVHAAVSVSRDAFFQPGQGQWCCVIIMSEKYANTGTYPICTST
jgi:hypothetical protein